MNYIHNFKCSVCGTMFDLTLDGIGQKNVLEKCWEMQRDYSRPQAIERRTGCTGAVRWNSWDIKPKLAKKPPDPEKVKRELYTNVKYGRICFTKIPKEHKENVRTIIGVIDEVYKGKLERDKHVTNPRGNKAGQPVSAGTKEYTLGKDEEGRMTRGNYNGVYAFYYSITHAAMTYTYRLITDNNGKPYLRGGAKEQLQQP